MSQVGSYTGKHSVTYVDFVIQSGVKT